MNPNEAVIKLSKKSKGMVIAGSIFLMLSIAFFGVGFAVIQGPILEQMNGSEYFSILTIVATLGLVATTPIGGKLGDLYGRKSVIMIAGLLNILFTVGMIFSTRSIILFLICRLGISLAQGAFTAAPYILMREVNPQKDVPKYMGLLASAVAIGGLIGSILLGAIADLGMYRLAMSIGVIPLIIGMTMIFFHLPNRKKEGKIHIDVKGICLLTLSLTAFALSLNLGNMMGWLHWMIIGGFIIAIISFIGLIKVEKTSPEPIIPLKLFDNKQYVVFLLVGFICYFYQVAMNNYEPRAVQSVMGLSSKLSATILLPRTVLAMILPAIFGIWVAKSGRNKTIAMLVATGFVVIAYAIMLHVTPETSIMTFYIGLAFTGVAEAMGSVAVTPAAQSTLEADDLGIGTSLVTFVNSLSSLIAASVLGAVYSLTPNDVQAGINHVHYFVLGISIVGVIIVLAFVRPYFKKVDAEAK